MNKRLRVENVTNVGIQPIIVATPIIEISNTITGPEETQLQVQEATQQIVHEYRENRTDSKRRAP